MLGALRRFAERHRKKLIFTTIFAGGAWLAWRVLLPRLQEHLLQKLLQELARSEEGDPETRRRAAFEHKQQVADGHARRKMAVLRARQAELFEDEACMVRLKEAKTKDDKLAAFKALQVECLARAVSSLYSLHIMLLLHRIAFNIVGREMASAPALAVPGLPLPMGDAEAPPTEGEDAHAAFLGTLDCLQEEGAAQIAKAVRRGVQACSDRGELMPTSQVTGQVLQKLLVDSCRESDKFLIAPTLSASTLLPEGLESRVSDERHRGEVKRLLDEARDYLESPQVLQVFQVATEDAARRLAAGLQEELGGGDGPWPLAKFFGPLTKLAGLALDVEQTAAEYGGGAAVQRFAADHRVGELCEGLYFQQVPAKA